MKRFLVSVVVIFVLSMALGYFIHGFLLQQHYAQLPSLFRPLEDQERFFPYMLLAHALIAVGFVWIYLQGREDKPFLAQGVRFGVAVALLATVPMYLIYYAVQPMPATLVVKQIVFDASGVLLMGVVVAWLNRGRQGR